MLCVAAKKTVVTKEDRERNRQVLLQEIDATCQAEHEERLRQWQKKMACRSDLLGQMEYNTRRRCQDKEEQSRMNEKQRQAENLFQEEIKYLLDNPFELRWNPKRTQLPDEIKIPCTHPH